MINKMKLLFYIFLTVCFFCPDGQAGEQVQASYMARGAGMHLMDAEMVLARNNAEFQMTTRTKTRGLLSVLLDAKTTFISNGKIIDNQFIDTISLMNSLSGKKTKNRVVDLKNKSGFIDYQTAVLQMMFLPFPTDKSFKVYDGKRELLISFLYQGERKLLPNDYSDFGGVADYYLVTIEILAGRKKGWFFNRMDDKTAPPLKVYFASVPATAGKVLVRGDFDTSLFGTISVYLTGVEGQKSDAIKN